MATTREAPQIHLYAIHDSPYSQRVYITLKELQLPYTETLIDVDKPREPWYLQINPRGLIPALTYSDTILKGEILTESSIIVQFLADAHPSHLIPKADDAKGALARARINFFVDTWMTKVNPFQRQVLRLGPGEEKDEKVREWVGVIEREVEPLLVGAGPYFGGSERLTLAEVNVAPFLVRWYSITDENILPGSFKEALAKLPNFSKWAECVRKNENVMEMFDAEKFNVKLAAMLEKMRAVAK